MSPFTFRLIRRPGKWRIAIVDVHTRSRVRLYVETLLDARTYVA
jgi:hypothetical protein